SQKVRSSLVSPNSTATLLSLTVWTVSAAMHVSVLVDTRAGPFGEFLLLSGGLLHDSVRSARRRPRIGSFAGPLCAVVWPQGSLRSVLGLPPRSARGRRPQECRTDGSGLWSTARGRSQSTSGARPAALSHLLALGSARHPPRDPGGLCGTVGALDRPVVP